MKQILKLHFVLCLQKYLFYFCSQPSPLDTYLKLLLRVPDHQVAIVTRNEAALPVVKATELGSAAAEDPHHVRQGEATPPRLGPEQRQAWGRERWRERWRER